MCVNSGEGGEAPRVLQALGAKLETPPAPVGGEWPVYRNGQSDSIADMS